VENDALENLPQHFRVNRHFLRQRRVLANGEVVGFEQVGKEGRESFVANFELGRFGPEFIVIEQAAVKERDALKMVAEARFCQTAKEAMEEFLIVAESVSVPLEFRKVPDEIIGLLIEPSAILGKIQEDQSLDKQLRLCECFLWREVGLVLAQIVFDGAYVAVEFLEELVGKRLFVEGFVAEMAEFQFADLRT
jgi:hypothetical protein